MKKAAKILITLIALGAASYVFRAQLLNLWRQLNTSFFPCAQPIGYTIGSFDARFGISKEEFTRAINRAEQIWEKPLGKELFISKPNGNLKINLVYDYRQEATVRLQKLGLTINDDRTSYDALKSKLKSLENEYTQKSTLLKSQIAIFENHKNIYEKKVAFWNERGGATPKAYAELNDERAALDAELAQLNKTQDNLNAMVNNINAVITVLNRLAETLNIDAKEFNLTNKSRGDEFEEGLYQRDSSGQKINIYQFDNNAKLIRVLAHELGHALGLDHIDDTKAIMYRLNQGANSTPTAADLKALKALCKVK